VKKEKRPEAKHDQSQPAEIKKGLQNSTRVPKKSSFEQMINKEVLNEKIRIIFSA